jgi:hypothetical protein
MSYVNSSIKLNFNQSAIPLELFYLLKPHQNPLGTFKDLSIHEDRQQAATLFYTK